MACIDKKTGQDNLLTVIYGDVTLGVSGRDFHYIFSYQKGGLESMVMDGREWLYRPPMPTFWRALTDNDRGSQFHLRSGMWLSADVFPRCIGFEVFVNGEKVSTIHPPENNCHNGNIRAEIVKVIFTYETITMPSTTVKVSYQVKREGSVGLDVHYHGKEGLPELPVFGMRFVMPTKATGYTYEGISGETYPDRMAGGISGIYQIEGLPVTKYLVPQDCGVHMKTKWLEVERITTLNNSDGRKEPFSLRFESKDKEFSFSCLPFLPLELESATHHEELPLPRRTIVSILGAVRGVGGIDSWGSDVEEPYHIDATKDIIYSFEIKKVNHM